ncbi:MAG TPA: thiamine pyrophosphate-dependent dehydrogenase E1 component subunit alpha [Bryobacteraceae bacterium]|nr:thiamine pyrophosphate-dependent dehydrogenase E1 component subunit alpha [Bryobacteraceae bacterium]
MAAPNLLDLSRASQAAGSTPDPAAGLARRALYFLILQRECEDRIERKLYRQGKILGGVYVGRGQEAIGIGAGLAVEADDVLFPSHRDLGLLLVRGVTPAEVFAQYMGRAGGLTRGRDGNMHMGDMKRRIVAIISSIGASIPVAAGAALALQYRGSRNIVLNIFGDGATSRGDFHEGVNFAAVQKLPIVFVCNNNQYAYSTPIEKQMAVAHVADRAGAYGVPAEMVDGNDLFAVHEAVGRAAVRARAGAGPTLIECKTFRMTGHSAHDSGAYVPDEMWAEWEQRDPIARLERQGIECGWLKPEEIRAVRSRVRAEVDAAVAGAEACPYPDASELLDGVYAES